MTTIEGVGQDLNIDLSSNPAKYLVDLAALIDAEPDYEATLLYASEQQAATQSIHLDPLNPALESHLQLLDPDYECIYLAFPNHAHRQPAMTMLNELGYAAARSGGLGTRPFFSEASYNEGYMSTYGIPLAFPTINNAWDEATTRSKFQNRMTVWKANQHWRVLMAHNEIEADSIHVAWMLDEVSSDPDIWIATFGEVASFLNSFYVDVGTPLDESGTVATAWIHGLSPSDTTWAVVTAYNSALQESGWSNEVAIPPYVEGVTGAPALGEQAIALASPNPFTSGDDPRLRVDESGPDPRRDPGRPRSKGLGAGSRSPPAGRCPRGLGRTRRWRIKSRQRLPLPQRQPIPVEEAHAAPHAEVRQRLHSELELVVADPASQPQEVRASPAATSRAHRAARSKGSDVSTHDFLVVRVAFEEGEAYFRMLVEGPVTSLSIAVPRKPVSVEFDNLSAVLANFTELQAESPLVRRCLPTCRPR